MSKEENSFLVPLSHPSLSFLFRSDRTYTDMAAQPFHLFSRSLLRGCPELVTISAQAYAVALFSSVDVMSDSFLVCFCLSYKVRSPEVELIHVLLKGAFLTAVMTRWQEAPEGMGSWLTHGARSTAQHDRKVMVAGAWGRWSHGIHSQEAGRDESYCSADHSWYLFSH